SEQGRPSTSRDGARPEKEQARQEKSPQQGGTAEEKPQQGQRGRRGSSTADRDSFAKNDKSEKNTGGQNGGGEHNGGRHGGGQRSGTQNNGGQGGGRSRGGRGRGRGRGDTSTADFGGVKTMQGADMTARLPSPPKARKGAMRLVALGGISEIGRNMTVFEYNSKLLIVDCGVLFPSSTEPGVDLILPDFDHIEHGLEQP